jgi:hypothetical protein
MDPRDLETIKRAIEATIKAHAEGQVPFAWVAVVCGALVSVIGVLWAWGFKQSQAWVAKIEEVSKAQRDRDDSRDATTRERYTTVIDNLKKEGRDELGKVEDKLKRLEAGRDFIREQGERFRAETELWLRQQLVESTKTLDQANDLAELLLKELERRRTDERDD